MKSLSKDKNKLYLFLYIITMYILAVPSIIYILKNKTIVNFTITFNPLYIKYLPCNINTLIFLIPILFLIFIYIKIITKSYNFTKKQIIAVILLSILASSIIIPQMSTDVYTYIATGWLDSNYNENPYYKTVENMEEDLQINNRKDEMFSNMFYRWKKETVVYGPAWQLLTKLLTKLSFGNLNLSLVIFKTANTACLLLCCYLIYKMTKSIKYFLLFSLNPLVLLETLSNVHNDIYIILLMLLAIYFVKEKRKLWLSVVFVALATCMKYFAILILPFFILYYYKDKPIHKKIFYCIVYGIELLLVAMVIYSLYIRDFNVLQGLFLQQNKFNRSITLVFYIIFGQNIAKIFRNIILLFFIAFYAYTYIKLLLMKNITFEFAMQKYNLFLFLFLFVLITNFNSWYILWLLPTLTYQKEKTQQIILYTTFAGILYYSVNYLIGDSYMWIGVISFTVFYLIILLCNIIQKSI